MMYGWIGTILRVDLSSGKIIKEPLSKELRVNYLGGRGINARVLYDEVKPGTDGFAPENVLIIGTGPLSGTMVASGRLNMTTMSPLTKILGDTNGGSHFGPELKYAGYDHIVFTGKADRPVYLWINNDEVELRNAGHLWGKLTGEVSQIIKNDANDPDVQVTCIGPAGEKLVRLASVVIGIGGHGGKSGIGAVMGSKNLKAVAVKGTRGVKVANPESFRILAKNLMQRMMQNEHYADLSTYGTTYLLRSKHLGGTDAFRNAQQTGQWAGYDEISPETLSKKYGVKSKACLGCPNHCRNFFEIKDGPYAGLKGIRFELSTQSGFGVLCDNSYAPSLYKAFDLCNQYGLDQSECGQEIAAAMEWYQKGIITKKDTDGIELEWGNHDAIIKMIQKISNREGIGDLLAEGGVRAARKLGKEAEECISYSKMALRTTGDVRSMTAYMLGEATSTRGADHLRGSRSAFGRPGQYEGCAKAVYDNQFVCTLADALEVCKFNTTYLRMEMGLKDMAELLSAATGIKFDETEMKEIADRIWNLERAFIVREGITCKDDYLHGRYLNEPIHGGPLDGLKIDKEKWDKMLEEYYNLNGWDKKTGIPTRTRLEELGLNDIADDLEKMGKLPA
jgi:aldehyde:ferredoxin oxidoreductase